MEALRKGFEPLRGVSLNSSQGCRRGPLGYLSIFKKQIKLALHRYKAYLNENFIM
jgi:hypothetical protein